MICWATHLTTNIIMKTKLVLPVIVAGIAQAELSPLSDYVTPYVDGRYRYEDRSQNGTLNTRTLSFQAGAKIDAEWGFGGLVEYEVVHNFEEIGNLDPDVSDFNQYYVSYNAYDTTIKYGRQQINLGAFPDEGGQAIVGGVAWRQNEQTFDAVSIKSTYFDDFTIFASYSDQANIIFADTNEDAVNHEGEFVFVNVDYTGFDFPITAYYVDNSYESGPLLNGTPIEDLRDGNTFGLHTKIGGLYLEGAVQNGDEYAHIAYSTKVGKHSLRAGLEQLNGGFSTPFSTAHKFGGWADAILGQRVNGTGNGTSDFYLKYATKLPFGVVFKAHGHYFTDDTYSQTVGSELDLLLVKQITAGVKGIFKFADFDGAGSAPLADREIYTAEINFSF